MRYLHKKMQGSATCLFRLRAAYSIYRSNFLSVNLKQLLPGVFIRNITYRFSASSLDDEFIPICCAAEPAASAAATGFAIQRNLRSHTRKERKFLLEFQRLTNVTR
jgi:hypothetical protein